MKIRYMKEFIKIAEVLNFSRAAELLYMTQPALSRHVAIIEENMGVQLLNRTTHAVELTVVGKMVYQEFCKIVSQYDTLIASAKQYSEGFVGEVKVGILYYAIDEYMTAVHRHFKKNYPQISLSVASHQSSTVMSDLLSGNIDVGITMNFGPFGQAENEGIISHDFSKERMVLIVSADHPFTRKESVDISELSGETYIYIKREIPEFNIFLKNYLTSNNAIPAKTVYTEQIDTLAFDICETNGVSLMPRHLKSMKRDGLAFVDVNDNGGYIKMSMFYRSDNSNPIIPIFIKQTSQLFQTKK